MRSKRVVYIGFIIGSLFGNWIGSLISGGWLTFWGIGLSLLGAIFGIWAGFKISKKF